MGAWWGVLSCSGKLRLTRALYRTCNVGSGVRGIIELDETPGAPHLSQGPIAAVAIVGGEKDRWCALCWVGVGWLVVATAARGNFL